MSGDQVVAAFDDLLSIGYGVPEILEAVGKSYDTTKKAVLRHNRPDLSARMSEWKRADNERLRRARGEIWT